MNQELVSVITPCYNDGKYIMETVECVQQSTYPKIEHLIINDGSTDEVTLKVLRNINLPNVRVINIDNQGVSQARNIAIAQANGKYILPLDSDDLISPTYIEQAVEILEREPNVKVVATNYQTFGRGTREYYLAPFSLEHLVFDNIFTVSSVFRKSDFAGFNPNMRKGYEDWDFWLSMLKNGGEVRYLSEFNFFYRTKEKNESRNNFASRSKNTRELRRQLWDNHQELFSKYYTNVDQYIEQYNIKRSKENKFFPRIGRSIKKRVVKLFGLQK